MRAAVPLLTLAGAAVANAAVLSYNGLKAQFWLPRNESTQLMTCDSVAIYGHVMPSGVASDVQQWFDEFSVHFGGKEVLALKVRIAGTPDVRKRVADALALKARIEGTPDVRKRVADALASLHRLNTLDVAVDGNKVLATGTRAAGNGAVAITLAQDRGTRIGEGYSELASVVTDKVSVQFRSALALKFPASSTHRMQFTHIDVTFAKINSTGCTGLLPQIWGTRPMSSSTAKFLSPLDRIEVPVPSTDRIEDPVLSASK